jgi:predicted enzyme related to lactoylglutathione lyase
MSTALPALPAGAGQHPIVLVVITARDLAAAAAFYQRVFGWQAHPLSAELAAGTPSIVGPGFALRTNMPSGFQSAVPFIHVPNVAAALETLIADGATLDRAPVVVAGAGTMARFADANGTVWGLTDGTTAAPQPPVPMPFGSNPKPPAHSICSLEMYAADGDATGAWFAKHFGWGVARTMPHYMGFDPGAGIGGVFQSHTPVAKAMTYVYASDVPATVQAVEAAGGARMGDPMAMPGMGTFGYFSDVSETVIGLIGP